MSAEAVQVGSRARPTLERERRNRLESIGSVALLALAAAVLVYLSFNAGGYFPSASGIATIVLAQALVLRSTLADRPFEGFSRALSVPLIGLALYAGWQLASALWAQSTARALDSFDTTLLYVLALALFGSVRYTRRRADWLVRVLVATLAGICLIGLVSRTLPHVWPTAASFYDDRLNFPLTYWNAEGMIAAIALILGFHLSAERSGHWSVRVLAAAALPALAATLLLTFSRGALGVAVIGLLVYCLSTRLQTLPCALLALVPACAIALRCAWDATLLASTTPTSAAAVAQGRHVAVVVGACMLGAGALRAALVPVEDRLAERTLARARPRRAVRVAVVGALAGIVVALALVLGAFGVARRQYEKFVNTNVQAHALHTRDRLSEVTNNGRLSLWRAAVRIYHTEELHGTGAGTYQLYYTRYIDEGQHVVDAHSLYLQSLAELGIVGFVLILVVVFGILGGLALRIRGPDRALYAALFAATLAWAVHQAFDWDWQMPAVTLGVFMLAGLALARPYDGRVGLSGLPAGRTFVALAWLVLAITPLLLSSSYVRLHHGAQELQRGDCVAAKREALSSLSLYAKRPQAYVIVGVCDLEQGFAQAAVPAVAQAAALEPHSWEDQFWLADARAGAGVDPHAAIARAIALDPLESGLRHAALRLRSEDPRAWERAAPVLRREALSSGRLAITSL